MFILVRLLNGLPTPLWYHVPDQWQQQQLLKKIVQVPLRNSIVPAIVINQYKNKPKGITFTIKDAHAIEPLPNDLYYDSFITQISKYYQVDQLHFIKRIRQFVQQKQVKHRASTVSHVQHVLKNDVLLTKEQQAVCDFLIPRVTQSHYTPTVLHGVTGSGKTESYKTLIKHTIEQNKTALLLLPEITLAIAFEYRLRQELPNDILIFGFHSGKTAKEKRELWQQLLAGKAILIIGVHLPILLPIANLGLIIVDEEHEVGYQEKKHPKIHTKEVAIWRANLSHIPILLGSATPSLQTLYNVKVKKWHFFQLKKRFSGAFPTIQTVFLLEKKQRKQFWITSELEKAITNRLQKKEQTIIFLNRRGVSFFVQCKQCSFIFNCKNCSVSLTLHNNNILSCHYCDLSQQLPTQCPSCKAHQEFLKKGIGTQKVVTILQKLFPQARIARADLDTSIKKKQWQQTIHDMENRNIDILVGTQTIAKGLHFPNVTLVGILWADLNLHFPIFNAAETTLQQLIQVAGRAGRNHQESTVIVQAMANHSIFAFLNETAYPTFYSHAMRARKELGYPPYRRLVEIELKNSNEMVIEQESIDLIHLLQAIREQKKLAIHILGPAQPPVAKIKNIYVRKIYLKSDTMNDIIVLFQRVNQDHFKSKVFFTPNPVT